MQPEKSNPKAKFIVFGGIAFVIVIILTGAVYAAVQFGSSETESKQSEQTTQSTETSSDKNTVTQQTLNQGMNDLNETIEQGKEAHADAAAAVNDPTKRVKVSE